MPVKKDPLLHQKCQRTSTEAEFANASHVKFPTSFRSSRLDWQLRNQIAKFGTNFGNSEQTSEPIRQKLSESASTALKTKANEVNKRTCARSQTVRTPNET